MASGQLVGRGADICSSVLWGDGGGGGGDGRVGGIFDVCALLGWGGGGV